MPQEPGKPGRDGEASEAGAGAYIPSCGGIPAFVSWVTGQWGSVEFAGPRCVLHLVFTEGGMWPW